MKNNFAAGEYRRLNSNMSILMHLMHNDGSGHWREINEAGAKVQAVTAADVQRVAKPVFHQGESRRGIYTRKAGEMKTKVKHEKRQLDEGRATRDEGRKCWRSARGILHFAFCIFNWLVGVPVP